MMTHLRRFVINLFVSGNLAVANGQATFIAPFRIRVQDVVMALKSTGATSGSTVADVKVNGNSIMPAAALTIAQGSATKYVKSPVANGSGHPSGIVIQPGDVVTVDITAVPGTASVDLRIDLSCIPQDV